MGWLARLLGVVPKKEMEGIQLNTAEPYWELDGPKTFTELFSALIGLFPEDTVLYFEGGSPDTAIEDFVARHSVPEESHLAMGTIWPRPRVFHIPAKTSILRELARIMDDHAEPELAVHFHVYRDGTVLLEWHDAFDQPMLISGDVPGEKIRVFADKIGKSPRRIVEPDQ